MTTIELPRFEPGKSYHIKNSTNEVVLYTGFKGNLIVDKNTVASVSPGKVVLRDRATGRFIKRKFPIKL